MVGRAPILMLFNLIQYRFAYTRHPSHNMRGSRTTCELTAETVRADTRK